MKRKKYARITNQCKCQMQKRPGDNLWPRDGNLGDCMQTLGVENVYHKAGITDLAFVNRDDIKEYQGAPVKLVMQSWFGDYAGVFPLPWSDKITPVFIGFHLNTINNTRERFVREKIHEKMKPYEPIGCRDRSTRDFLKSLGVDAYFSGCMTLTFDKREIEPKNGKIFLVDPDRRVLKRLPENIKKECDTSITHFYYWNEYPVTEKGAKEFEQYARTVLNRYKTEARLVITSKIHVAMPCVAMGIPVIFITTEPNNVRFDVLRGILPVYGHRDMKYIDWNPKPVNIDTLKEKIIANAIAQITGKNRREAVEALNKETEKLKPIRVAYLKWVSILKSLLTPPPPPENIKTKHSITDIIFRPLKPLSFMERSIFLYSFNIN